MIKSISVEGFKSLNRLPKIDLGTVNVFIGANGSGKTNILEAVGLASAAVSGEVGADSLLKRGVRLGEPRLYKSSFTGTKFRVLITLKVEGKYKGKEIKYILGLNNPIREPNQYWNYHSEGLTTNGKRIFGRSPRSTKIYPYKEELQKLLPQYSRQKSLAPIVKAFIEDPAIEMLNRLENYRIYEPNTPTLRGTVLDESQDVPIGLKGGRLPESVNEMFNSLIENNRMNQYYKIFDLLGWVKKLTITRPSRELISPHIPVSGRILKFEDRYMRKGRNTLSAYDTSEGALYMLFVFVLAIHPKAPEFFAIENFDQAMNPRLARAVTRQFCDIMLNSTQDKQVLMTTHNPLVLDGLDITDDRIRLFAVNRSSAGKTVVKRVQLEEDVIRQAQEGFSLSQLWVMGRLGGIPNV